MSTRDSETKTDSQLASAAESASPWTTANLLTFLRIGLTFPFLYFIVQGRFGFALAVFFLASVTDFADGYVARKFKQQSRLGELLDPVADKLLTTAAFVAMAVPHAGFPSIPVWLAAAVVGRDLVIVLGSFVVYRLADFREFKPTRFGKINTLVELGLIVWFLVFHTTGQLIFLLPFLYGMVIVSIVVSGTEYVIRGLAILKDHYKNRPPSFPQNHNC